jgi:hypothetical protein
LDRDGEAGCWGTAVAAAAAALGDDTTMDGAVAVAAAACLFASDPDATEAGDDIETRESKAKGTAKQQAPVGKDKSSEKLKAQLMRASSIYIDEIV